MNSTRLSEVRPDNASRTSTIEAAGQALIWLAPSSALMFVGAALTGLGYSLVYPAFGVEAVRLAPPQSRGLAMGAYTAFLDLALGLANPALGLIASGAGLSAVFLASTLIVLCAAAIAMRLLRAPSAAFVIREARAVNVNAMLFRPTQQEM
jgi:MFS family permease